MENGLNNGKSRARWLVTDGPSLALQLLTSIHCPCGHQLRRAGIQHPSSLSISRKNMHRLRGEWFQSSALCPILLAWVIVSIRWIRWEENWNRIPWRDQQGPVADATAPDLGAGRATQGSCPCLPVLRTTSPGPASEEHCFPQEEDQPSRAQILFNGASLAETGNQPQIHGV